MDSNGGASPGPQDHDMNESLGDLNEFLMRDAHVVRNYVDKLTMAEYKLAVTTADVPFAGTYDYTFVTLFGTEGESKRTELGKIDAGKTGHYTVKTSSPLGQILLVKIEIEPLQMSPEKTWFCSKVVVTTPENDEILFPCHRWLARGEHELRGGRATKVFEDDHPLLIDRRKKELLCRQAVYQWRKCAEGLPYCTNFKDKELPAEICFSLKYKSERFISKQTINAELKLKGLKDSTDQWKDLEAMKKVFWFNKTPISEYVSEHWKEDDFYGYQFLNATNPNVICRCSKLPSNFPVTEEMVKPFLEDGSSLQMEMMKGNIFICDYKMMDGLHTREYKGGPLPLTPGLCLFHMNSEKKLMPIAIQLNQQPSEQNAIYLRSDPETDWLLAKMFLKNADTLLNQTVYHLLNTHLLAEVFAIATLRCLPGIHPIYKLLMPHFHYTLQQTFLDREQGGGPGGILAESTLAGITELMRRAHSETTYSSLCLPENIEARGLESIPNFYYRDDGLKLWDVITSFVKAIVLHYYPSDNDVCKDTELQAWVSDIFTYAFLGSKSSGIPASFLTAEEVIKFITMVIFTVSAQHAAVHSGQFDYNSWMPNNPLMLLKAPPTTKGESTMETILETLPNKGITARSMATAWMLSQRVDFVPLGSYTDEMFDEAAPKKTIELFQEELSRLSDSIAERNSELLVPYNYLNPAEIENSTCI